MHAQNFNFASELPKSVFFSNRNKRKIFDKKISLQFSDSPKFEKGNCTTASLARTPLVAIRIKARAERRN